MQSLITVLFLLAMLGLPLHLTLIRNRVVMLVWLLCLALFIYLMHPSAIEQSYSRFEEQAANHTLVNNFIVLQIIEAIGGALLSIFLIRLYYNEPIRKAFRFFKYLPGIVIFPAIYYTESFLFLNFAGINFKLLAVIFASVIPLVLYLLMLLIKKFVGELDVRLELKFLLHMFQVVVSVIVSIYLFQLPVRRIPLESPLLPLVVLSGLAGLSLFAGIIIYNHNLKKFKNRVHGSNN